MNDNQRRAIIVSGLVDVSFGTMWWVRDWLWELVIPRSLCYHRNRKKKEHPGISILDAPPPCQSPVPMMHGTTPKGDQVRQSSVLVAGFSAEDLLQLTSFGHLIRPNLLPQVWIGHFPVDKSAFRREWVQIFGADSVPPPDVPDRIRSVHHKPKATPQECAQLLEFLKRMGIA